MKLPSPPDVASSRLCVPVLLSKCVVLSCFLSASIDDDDESVYALASWMHIVCFLLKPYSSLEMSKALLARPHGV